MENNIWHVWKDNQILFTGNGKEVSDFYHKNGGKEAGLRMICFKKTVLKYQF